MRKQLSRRQVDRLENILILLLACSALFLLHRTGIFQSITGQGTGGGSESFLTGVQDTALARGTPVRLMVQTSAGRYGVQYDQEKVDSLYQQGLNDLLMASVDAMDLVKEVSQETWQQAVTQSGTWVYYDFLYDVSFTGQSSRGEGAARRYLITGRNGRAESVYYYNEGGETYYQGQLRESGLPLPEALEGLPTNQGRFAFEDGELSQLLAPDMMLLSQPILCPVYTASNPVADWGAEEREALLKALDFNLRAAAIYETADGTVIQEGSDTLRIQKSGKVIFHGAESGEARFQALSAREKDLQIKAEELLAAVAQGEEEEGRMLCQAIETGADGSVELRFCRLLGGAEVQVWEEGWSARFVFSGSSLTGFTIYLREYTPTGETRGVLLERQAAAAAAAQGQTGKELQIYYPDNAASELLPGWSVRENHKEG